MKYTSIFLIVLLGISMARVHSPADAVLNKIDNLIQGTRDEQAAQTRLFSKQTKRYNREVAFRENEIRDAEVANLDASRKLAQCSAEKPVAKAAYKNSQKELVLTKVQLGELEKEHKQFNKVYAARQQEHAAALANIQAAYNIIGSFANGKRALNSKPVFVEVSEKINSVFKVAVKHSFHSDMIPVMAALVEITQVPATQIQTSALTRVVNLLRKLEAAVRKSDGNHHVEVKEYNKSYQSSKALLNVQISSLKVIINKYRVYLGQLRSCIKTETKIKNLAYAKLVRNQKIKTATIQLYNAQQAKFTQQSKQRADYVTLLQKLSLYVEKAIADFDHGLYSRKDFVNTL